MRDDGYPPDPVEQLSGPQPEICDLCGLPIPAARMVVVDDGPLAGRMICDVTPSCKQYRELPSSTKRELYGHVDWSPPRRLFDAGGPIWWDLDPPNAKEDF